MNSLDKEALIECISADLKLIQRKTEIWQMSYCEEVIHDISMYIMYDYLSEFKITMNDINNNIIRCNRYILIDTLNKKYDKPGSIDWDGLGGTELNVILSYTDIWQSLSVSEKNNFAQKLKITWYAAGPSYLPPSLNKELSKTFSSENSHIQRIDYK